jgi:hypothetical protein
MRASPAARHAAAPQLTSPQLAVAWRLAERPGQLGLGLTP